MGVRVREQVTCPQPKCRYQQAGESEQCKKCGKIARNEFSPADRAKMAIFSVLMVISAVALLVVVLWLVSE